MLKHLKNALKLNNYGNLRFKVFHLLNSINIKIKVKGYKRSVAIIPMIIFIRIIEFKNYSGLTSEIGGKVSFKRYNILFVALDER